MDNTKSISQGAFLSIPPGFSLAKLRRRKKRKAEDDDNELWECSFKKIWSSIECEMKKMNDKLFSKVLEELVKHIGSVSKSSRISDAIPCELLLTGTNLPDHNLLLDSLTQNINTEVTPYVATVWSNEASNLKSAIQSFVKQIINQDSACQFSDDSDEDDLDDCTPEKRRRFQASQLSLGTLAAWYEDNADEKKPPVVLIVPDFESFSSTVLGDLITLLCSYESVPFILVLGVATSPSAVYQGLSRAVLSRLVIQLFHSEASPSFLNHVIEKILLSDKCPFRLGGRTMTYLTDVFLFHSFSVKRFIQGFKYCMLEHFYRKDLFSVCCEEDDIPSAVRELPEDALEDLRKLKSFQKHVENSDLSERKLLLLDNSYTKKFLVEKLKYLHSHTADFIMALKCLNIVARDLPGSPLGRHVRELYRRAVSNSITTDKDFKQSILLIEVQAMSVISSKLVSILDILKIDSILDILNEEVNRFDGVITKLEDLKRVIDRTTNDSAPQTNGDVGKKDVRKNFVQILANDLFESFLVPPTSLLLHEIMYFDDLDLVRRRISGAPRNAIHRALNNPHQYLQCDCCELPNLDAVLPSLPDLSIVYKLYLESNKTISLFDWLQSFSAVIQPEDDGENGEIDQKIQARFTKAVSELQFLGFIKPSKAKTDHVTRLVFGNF